MTTKKEVYVLENTRRAEGMVKKKPRNKRLVTVVQATSDPGTSHARQDQNATRLAGPHLVEYGFIGSQLLPE